MFKLGLPLFIFIKQRFLYLTSRTQLKFKMSLNCPLIKQTYLTNL